MTQTVLFPTDGSEHARGALRWMIDHLDPSDYAIDVLSVADDVRFEHLTESIAYTEVDEVRKWSTTRAQEITDDAEEELRRHEFQAERYTRVGDPGPVICQVAKELEVDRIVMSRRGRGRVGEFLLGSVSQYVLHHATVAVTFAPPVDE